MSETKSIDKWMEKHVLWKYEGDEKEVIIPSHINIIAQDAFNGSTVESVIIPNSVGIIGVNALSNGGRFSVTTLFKPFFCESKELSSVFETRNNANFLKIQKNCEHKNAVFLFSPTYCKRRKNIV